MTKYCKCAACAAAHYTRRHPFETWPPLPKLEGWSDTPTVVVMNSPLDWDYAELKKRMQEIKRPPFKSGNSAPGQHCMHCPKDDAEQCQLSCSATYRELYGCEPT